MVIVPSIDVRSARVVARAGYTELAPSELARRFVEDGAEELHLVDLDMAERGDPANLALLAHIARSSGAPARLAGGIASVAFAHEAIDAGFRGVLFSSAVFGDDELLREISRLGDAAIVELETRDDFLSPRGAASDLVEHARGRGVLAAARAAVERGIRHLYVIDLGSERHLGGPPLELLERIRDALGRDARHVRFHAGGGVSSLEDVSALARWGVASVVIGRAFALGTFTVAEAKAAAEGSSEDPASPGRASP